MFSAAVRATVGPDGGAATVATTQATGSND